MFGSIFGCEKKNSSRLTGTGKYNNASPSLNRSGPGLGGGGIQRQKSMTKKVDANAEMQLAIQMAPEETHNRLVWKWDSNYDRYEYQGMNSEMEISKGLAGDIMDDFFNDLSKMDNYSFVGMAKYLANCMTFWCIICYIPFLWYSCYIGVC